MAEIIDGKAFAAGIRQDVATKVAQLRQETGIQVGLAVILVGEDAASQVYVRNKSKAAADCGIKSVVKILPENTKERELLQLIDDFNSDDNIHGILVQLPLPPHINSEVVINAIDPRKDVDGFHVINVGRLSTGQDCLVPCTPQGCLLLLENVIGDLTGKYAVVVGRSNIVGKPMAQLLLRAGCTVTICHSKTRHLAGYTQQADIVIAAVGKPQMITGEWLKPSAVVIDVGINRIVGADGKAKLVGDVDMESAKDIVEYITPVPGGVGPMTIACLLRNTLQAASNIVKHADGVL